MDWDLAKTLFRYFTLFSILTTVCLEVTRIWVRPDRWRKWLRIITVVAALFALCGYIGGWISEDKLDEQRQQLPYESAVKTASLSIAMTIESPETINGGTHIKGCICAFAVGDKATLLTSTNQYIVRRISEGVYYITFQGAYDRAGYEPVKSVSALRDSKYLQISVPDIPAGSIVVSGTATILVNEQITLEVPIPRQSISEGNIVNRNLQTVFQDFPN